ncbi:uncharacterized protein LOC126845605 isoform X1 [Adelges cooleyi]|uniref:uncharacterized protein LOC126845605 isoform X1 n=1 Tax=Adelges cooleyi TaxID=133065 RepID=UPI00217F4E7E|nr:uncharacterized protein LOC126845605 isoform X1 [Adelges cooleyi]
MFSKTMILFFCVALYFSNCQDAPPNQNQLEAITRIVNAHKIRGGLKYQGLLEVVDQVKTETGANGNYFDRDAVEARIINSFLTKEDIVTYTRMILGDNESAEYIRALYDGQPTYKEEIKFVQAGFLIQAAAQARHRDTAPSTFQLLIAEMIRLTFLFWTKDDMIRNISEKLNFN